MASDEENERLVLEWAEKSGLENLKLRLDSGSLLAKGAETTLTVLLAGIGGSLAYAVKVFEPSAGPAAHAAVWVCGYLSVLALYLVISCMVLRQVPAVYNEPQNLNQPAYRFNDLRRIELVNLQERIDEWAMLNRRIGRSLNFVRIATALAPLVFVFGALYQT